MDELLEYTVETILKKARIVNNWLKKWINYTIGTIKSTLVAGYEHWYDTAGTTIENYKTDKYLRNREVVQGKNLSNINWREKKKKERRYR